MWTKVLLNLALFAAIALVVYVFIKHGFLSGVLVGSGLFVGYVIGFVIVVAIVYYLATRRGKFLQR